MNEIYDQLIEMVDITKIELEELSIIEKINEDDF